MSISQTKNIQTSLTVVDEHKPRSIRLTKAHREDIVDAVMKQWVTVNPVPTTDASPAYTLFKAIVAKYRVVTKKTPPECRELSRVLSATEELSQMLITLSESVKSRIKLWHIDTWQIQAVDIEGNKRNVCHIRLTEQQAKDLELTPSKVEDGYACFYAKGSYECHQILIPQDSPEYLEFRQQEELRKVWVEEQTAQRGEVTDYLNQFNTTGQIRDAWPELLPYLPAHIADPERVIQLPALTKSRLNERLGL